MQFQAESPDEFSAFVHRDPIPVQRVSVGFRLALTLPKDTDFCAGPDGLPSCSFGQSAHFSKDITETFRLPRARPTQERAKRRELHGKSSLKPEPTADSAPPASVDATLPPRAELRSGSAQAGR